MGGVGSDRSFEQWGLLVTLAIHGTLALLLFSQPPEMPRRRTVVEVDIRKKVPPPPPPVTPPKPEEPPPPPPKEPPRKVTKEPKQAETPKPSQTPQEPPKTVQPVFGLSPDQTSPNGTGVSVQTGNTTVADPSKRPKGPVEPLPPSVGVPGKEFRPVAEVDLRALPEQEGGADACVAGLKEKYGRSESYASGIEGEVVFRIELDDAGKIRSIKKVKGISREVDDMAVGWLRFNPRCRFKPAIARDGKPAAFIIERYSITFELGQ